MKLLEDLITYVVMDVLISKRSSQIVYQFFHGHFKKDFGVFKANESFNVVNWDIENGIIQAYLVDGTTRMQKISVNLMAE